MRKAISYCAMRVAISGSPILGNCSSFNSASPSSISRRSVAVDARRIGEIQHRIAAAAELDALMARRQKAAAPQAIEQPLVRVGAAAVRDHDDERRQIVRVVAEAVGEPRPQATAGPAAASRSG